LRGLAEKNRAPSLYTPDGRLTGIDTAQLADWLMLAPSVSAFRYFVFSPKSPLYQKRIARLPKFEIS
jgi:hypothetical protein